MNKREFLKKTACAGICSCVAIPISSMGPGAAGDEECHEIRDLNRRLEWRLNHAKRQFCTLLNRIESEIPEETRRTILEDMGRNCARSLGWAERYKGDPEGFFQHMFRHSGEKLSFDKTGRTITIVTRDRDCDCPVVDSSKAPAYYCDCSLGWQKETYETILGKPVEVSVVESVLRGSDKCVFKVLI
jgi:predicted hydrocarbon binding protein